VLESAVSFRLGVYAFTSCHTSACTRALLDLPREGSELPRLLSLPRLAAPFTVAPVVPPLAIWPLCEDAGQFSVSERCLAGGGNGAACAVRPAASTGAVSCPCLEPAIVLHNGRWRRNRREQFLSFHSCVCAALHCLISPRRRTLATDRPSRRGQPSISRRLFAARAGQAQNAWLEQQLWGCGRKRGGEGLWLNGSSRRSAELCRAR
jgi:hypothetical protein